MDPLRKHELSIIHSDKTSASRPSRSISNCGYDLRDTKRQRRSKEHARSNRRDPIRLGHIELLKALLPVFNLSLQLFFTTPQGSFRPLDLVHLVGLG